jgi:hypothetical protein
VGYEEPKRARKLTPFERELRASAPATESAVPGEPGLWRRFSRWRRGRRPPETLRGAVALGIVRLAVGLALGSALALLLAHLLDRAAPIAFYVVGAVILLSGLLGAQASRQRAAYEYAESGSAVRARPGVTLAAVGVLLLLVGAILETV